MRLVVWGSTGMLGRAVVEEARRQDIPVVPLKHSQFDLADAHDVREVFDKSSPEDVWLNCAGVIEVYGRRGWMPSTMARVNAEGPLLLAQVTAAKIPLIQVSTDCVFSGLFGPVSGKSPWHFPDALDIYGRSKALGELALKVGEHVTVVRTSFIGYEHGLLRFLLDAAADKREYVEAWSSAWWSGSTVYAVARSLVRMAANPPGGIQHLSTPLPITKALVVRELNQQLHLGLNIAERPKPRIMRALVPTVELQEFRSALPELVEKGRSFGITASSDRSGPGRATP